MVRHLHGCDPASRSAYRNVLISSYGYIAADQPGPKSRQSRRIVAVEHY
jgi:hypothetical protein